MKKGLLATTALIGAGAMMAGAAGAAEAPEWKLSGNMNFQFYWVDQDYATAFTTSTNDTDHVADAAGNGNWLHLLDWNTTRADPQDHDWYFGVDEAELALKVDGVADNGLKYGFKIEIQVNTDDGPKGIADEARIQLSGSWGTLQLGDEDGAEDTMNYGGENLMGATGGFDGDQGDYLVRAGTATSLHGGTWPTKINDQDWDAAAPGGPSIAGDTSDATKVTYYSPRFSGFQVGASITPTPNGGDDFKEDGDWENHYGLGANYDNSFGSLRVRASAVYSTNSSTDTEIEDVAAWSVGGIVGFGPFQVGANYTDNSDSGQLVEANGSITTAHWNAAASFTTGPMSFAAGYFVGTTELPGGFGESTYEHIALTADYKVAPGLGAYAEINMISDELANGGGDSEDEHARSNDTTSLILGMKVSF